MLTFALLQRDKHLVFEEPKSSSPKSSSADTNMSALSTQEWMETLDRSKEMAALNPVTGSYMGDEGFRDMSSGVSSHANTLNRADEISGGKATLIKNQNPADSDSVKAKKRFSRRHSKNGLSAVF